MKGFGMRLVLAGGLLLLAGLGWWLLCGDAADGPLERPEAGEAAREEAAGAARPMQEPIETEGFVAPAPVLEQELVIPATTAQIEFRIVDAAGEPRTLDWPLVLAMRRDESLFFGEEAREGESSLMFDLSFRRAVGGRLHWTLEPGIEELQVFASLGLTPCYWKRGIPDQPFTKGGHAAIRAWARPRGFLVSHCENHLELPEEDDETVVRFWGPWDEENLAKVALLKRAHWEAQPGPVDVVCDAPPIATLPFRHPDGRSLAGEAIVVEEDGDRLHLALDAKGRLHLAAGEARRFRIRARDDGIRPFGPRRIEVPALPSDTVLEPVLLPEAWCLARGRVVDPAGQPVVAATVSITAELEKDGSYLGERKFQLATDPDGRYAVRLPEVVQGTLIVSARQGAWAYATDQVVPCGEVVPDLVLPDVGGMHVAIAVPRGSAPVRILVDHEAKGRVFEDLGGWFDPRNHIERRIGPLPAGLVDLRVEQEGSQALEVRGVSVPVRGTVRDPRLEGLAFHPKLEPLELEVRGPDGLAATGALAMLQRWHRRSGHPVTLSESVPPDGWVRFRVAPSDDALLVLRHRSFGWHLVHRPENGQTIEVPRPCAVRLIAPTAFGAEDEFKLRPVRSELKRGFVAAFWEDAVAVGTRDREPAPTLLQPGTYRLRYFWKLQEGRMIPETLGTFTVPNRPEARIVVPHDPKALPKLRGPRD